ncbi:MAG: trypsin-like peptidase domain-containing protein, partial [Bacteroidota bacterium]
MNSALEKLLQLCTVKITVPGQVGWGTGFFVSPGKLLTCAHVVERTAEKPIQLWWNHKENWAKATVTILFPEPYDLALLELTAPTNVTPPCVYLGEEVHSRDPLYLFGYPDDGDPQGEPRTFDCDGVTGSEVASILFAKGQVRPGMSGAPLLNQRTGRVCGVVKYTRDRATDLGGGAIPTRLVLKHFPQLRSQQEDFHQQDKCWQSQPKDIEKGKNDDALEKYLKDFIQCEPDNEIISSTGRTQISLRQLYVPLEIQELNEDGSKSDNQKSVNSHIWVKDVLRSTVRNQIILIQGESGKGKTSFCKMLADEISKESSLGFTPVLIQLGELQGIKGNLAETLQPCLEYHDFFG